MELTLEVLCTCRGDCVRSLAADVWAGHPGGRASEPTIRASRNTRTGPLALVQLRRHHRFSFVVSLMSAVTSWVPSCPAGPL